MTAFRKILPFAGAILAIGMSVPMAQAQTPHSSLLKPTAMAAKMAAAGKWTCMSKMTVEIATVSGDVRSQAPSWVLVHRMKGEIIASERVDAHQIEQIRRLPCGTADSEDGGIAIG